MRATHSLGKLKIGQIVQDDVRFLLTNRLGDYLSFGRSSISRYQGWFVSFGDSLYKIVEDIRIVEGSEPNEMVNKFWSAERKSKNTLEKFFLLPHHHTFVYKLRKKALVEIMLDVKKSFDNSTSGISYEVFEEKGSLVVRCVKKEAGGKENIIYLAVLPDSLEYQITKKWILKHYSLDERRKSPPFERYVFSALQIKAKEIIFSVAFNKDKALREVRAASKKVSEIEQVFKKEAEEFNLKQKSIFKKLSKIFPKNKAIELYIAYLCAKYSLLGLLVSQQDILGLYAGLPWFFQFWSRDESISLKALFEIDPESARKIFFSLLEKLKADGRISNIVFRSIFSPQKESSDSVGWVFERASEFMEKNLFSANDLSKIKKYLEQSINGLLKYHTENGFAQNKPFETWMDTLKREGPRIEMQTLRLNMYKLAYQFFKESRYLDLEKALKKKVRAAFWNGKILSDGISDPIVRPNIFLAAYIYPELLDNREWMLCFREVLSKLWLEWGGLSTIDKSNTSFHATYTGEDAESYHKGDSWFWVNNLAALVLFRFNRGKFENYVTKILDASTKEILWKGAIGHHGEISSAKELGSEGCWDQAWSNAFYIELIEAIISHSY